MKEPNKLLDAVIKAFKLKNDAALARGLGVNPSVVCNIRKGNRPVTASFVLLIHDKTGWSIEKIRKLLTQETLL
jgi:DNA-binding transcriptional regulator YdaS (Cro superfamily)